MGSYFYHPPLSLPFLIFLSTLFYSFFLIPIPSLLLPIGLLSLPFSPPPLPFLSPPRPFNPSPPPPPPPPPPSIYLRRRGSRPGQTKRFVDGKNKRKGGDENALWFTLLSFLLPKGSFLLKVVIFLSGKKH